MPLAVLANKALAETLRTTLYNFALQVAQHFTHSTKCNTNNYYDDDREIRLYGTGLTGTIPESLSTLTALT